MERKSGNFPPIYIILIGKWRVIIALASNFIIGDCLLYVASSVEAMKGGGGGIRTHGTFRLSSFQDWRNRPLYHPSGGLAPSYSGRLFASGRTVSPASTRCFLRTDHAEWQVFERKNPADRFRSAGFSEKVEARGVEPLFRQIRFLRCSEIQ